MEDNQQERKIFGAALDPSDDPWSLELKQAWMNGAAEHPQRQVECYLDPYDAVTGELKEVLAKRNILPSGKFPVPSWLWPRPQPQDYPLVTSRKIADFYDSVALPALLKHLQDYVEKAIFPGAPVMLGVDHSATMAVISALAARYSPENLSVIVLDQHFDAIPVSARLAANARKLGPQRLPAGYPDQCCCGNFWSYLMQEGGILPQNLSFIGVADFPDKATGGERSPSQKIYRDFEEKGCRFFPLPLFEKPYAASLSRFIREGIKTSLVYLSLDLDVGSFNFTWAARYMDRPGISRENLLDIASQIREACRKKKASLAGFDIMEFNMHFLGIDTGEGVKDATIPLIGDFIDRLTA